MKQHWPVKQIHQVYCVEVPAYLRRIVANPRSMAVSAALVFVYISVLLMACSTSSGSGERALVLGGGTITEYEFTTEVRSLLAEPGATEFCAAIDGLSDRETVDVVKAGSDTDSIQESDPRDEERAGAIIQSECKRIR